MVNLVHNRQLVIMMEGRVNGVKVVLMKAKMKIIVVFVEMVENCCAVIHVLKFITCIVTSLLFSRYQGTYFPLSISIGYFLNT